ncbi:hypothetical protein [Lysobacter sp. CA199]|uniref:hypothetical protein n=1 Tax=Lysobacter sp. CA199 TaxID=3455608 RepID=UPI003F8D70CE
MRKDMYKVIVERPRRGGFHSSRPPYDRQDERQRESLAFRHRHDPKWLNENLRPLERYLERQVGRRWDFVYSQLCARVDRRNTVQQHIHQHIDDFVAVQVTDIDGELHVMQNWGGMIPLTEVRQRLYVDPRNGCVMRNEAAIALRLQRHREHCLAVQARQAGWQAEVRKLGERTQLRRIDGIWYEVELAPVPPRDEAHKPGQRKRSLERLFAFDAVTHKRVDRYNGERCRMYGKCSLYAHHKRQLSRAELLDHGLRNGTEPDTYAASLRSRPRVRNAFRFRAPIRSGALHKEH